MKATKEVKDGVQKVVDGLISSHPKGGEIALDDICSKMPSSDRWEVVTALKNLSQGVFVTGRRGLKSRFVYGEGAKEVAQAIKYRQNYRKRNTPSRKSSSEQRESYEDGGAIMSKTLSLEIGIGDQKTTIPITIGMVQTS